MSYATAKKSSSGVNRIGKSGLDSVETKFSLHADTYASPKPSVSMMLPMQEPKIPRKLGEISNFSKEVELEIDSIKDRPSAKGSFPESGRKQGSPMPLTSADVVPSVPGKVSQSNLATSKSQPDEKLSPSPTSSVSFQVPTSLFNSSLGSPSSLSILSSPASNSSSALSISRSLTDSKSSTDANQSVSSFTSAAFSSPFLSSGALSFQAPKPLVFASSPSPTISSTSESELQPAKSDVEAATTTPTLQPRPSTGGFNLNLEPSVSTTPTNEISTALASGSQPSVDNTASPARTTFQAEQPSSSHVLFPAQLTTSGSITGGKTETSDVSNTQEDDMDEEAPETTNTTDLSLESLGRFGLGSTPNLSAPKPNPFGGSFGNATTNEAASPFTMNVPSGELFRPASFSFQSPQPSQPSLRPSSNAFSGGFGTGTTAQAPSPSGFGQPAQIGVLGAGFAGTGSIGGYPSAVTGGAFAGAVPTGAGFASLGSAGRGFAGVASGGGGGGFSSMASASGGFAGATSAGFGVVFMDFLSCTLLADFSFYTYNFQVVDSGLLAVNKGLVVSLNSVAIQVELENLLNYSHR